jgi:hypothetical protein
LQALPDLANGVAQTVRRLTECDETFDMLAMEWLEEELEPIDEQTVWLPDEFLTELYPPVQMRILEGVMLEVLPDDAAGYDIPLDGLERLRDALAGPELQRPDAWPTSSSSRTRPTACPVSCFPRTGTPQNLTGFPSISC